MIRDIYLPLSVGFPRDPKVRALMYEHGQDGILAAYLYIMMCLYCRENLTDGWVPAAEVPALGYPLSKETAMQSAMQLVEVCMLRVSAGRIAPAYQVLAYVKRNGTRQDVERVSDQRRYAARTRWDGHHASTVHSRVQSNDHAASARARALTETESIDKPLSPVPAGTRATPETGREVDLAQVVIHEIRDQTGGLVIARERAAEVAAEIIGDRRLASPGAYVRKAIRSHPDVFALAGAPPAPDLPSTPPGKRRRGAADVPAAEAHRAASTVDGRARGEPASDEQRQAHAAAARAALAAKAAGREAGQQPAPPTVAPDPAGLALPGGGLDDDPF